MNKIKKSTFLALFYAFTIQVYTQEEINIKNFIFQEKIAEIKREFLLKKYSKNKTFTKNVELPSIVALQYYPELVNANIVFKKHNIPYSMDARPTFWSVFKKPKNRKYIIRINKKLQKNSGFLVDSLNFNAKVGIIGHELAHILFYHERTTIQLFNESIKYLFTKGYKRKIERQTDLITIERGLGIQVLEFRKSVDESDLVPQNYKKKQDKYYLSTDEIKEHMNKLAN